MRQKDILFDNIIANFDDQEKVTLKMMYYASERAEEQKRYLEMKQMEKEIIDKVLAQLSITLGTDEALQKINALNDAIENLNKGGK